MGFLCRKQREHRRISGGSLERANRTYAVASIRANIADATNATYFSWRGPTTAGSAAYYRIQGPNLFIEWAPQAMGGAATNHIHAMYRELSNDYGALITP